MPLQLQENARKIRKISKSKIWNIWDKVKDDEFDLDREEEEIETLRKNWQVNRPRREKIEIEKRKNQKELEQKTIEELKVLGYKQLFIEVGNKEIFVVIKYPEFTNVDAAKIMATIYKNFGNNYTVEIALKS